MKSLALMTCLSVASILMFLFAVPRCLVIESSVEDAVLKDNWQEVYDTLERDSTKANDPVARFLMGHACLATNRNNVSLLLFVSVQEESDLELWCEWTDSLQHRHPDNPVALYLSADAKARVGKLQEAKEGFTQALEMEEGFALAVNARGVVRALNKERDEALIDFYQATTIAPDFADAHASLGTYWITQEAPEGALEEFNKALAINPDFALAYNGRGCAYFGRGKYEYEMAIDDMQRAFELCPVLLVALSNQGLVLSAIASASRSTQEKPDSIPGTTFIARSDLEKMDYSSFTSADQMLKFRNSVAEIGKNDPVAAVRAYSAQLANIENRMDILSNNIEQMRVAVTASDRLARTSQNIDQAIGLIKIGNNAVNVIPDATKDWSRYLDLGSKTLQTTAGVLPEHTAGKMWMEVGSRALDPNLYKVVLREGAYFTKETADLYGDIAKGRLGNYTSELCLRTRQYYDLKQEQGKFLAEAINQGVDFSKMDILGIGSMRTMPTTSRVPIPEYSIPHQSPLTQFDVLPGAIGRDIAPPGKTSLVAIAGNTDPYRLGTLLRSFNERGVNTLPVPLNMDAQRFAQMIGADRIVKITEAPGSAAWLPKVPVPNPKVGGVTQDMSKANVDLGNWPVITSFGLFYQAGLSMGGQKEEGENKK